MDIDDLIGGSQPLEAEALGRAGMSYVHGYSEREAHRLLDQAHSVRDLFHHDTSFPVGSRILEPGCGTGAQTVTLASNSPGALFVSCDVATGSLEMAAERRRELGLDNVCLLHADLYELPFASTTFDGVFICHVLEHLKDAVEALRSVLQVVRPGGSVTVIEGDHGSCYFHPTGDEAVQAWRCLIRVQADLGGDSLIGRRLYSVMTEAGVVDPVVSPRMVCADRSRPEVMDAFVAKTIIPMVEGVEEEALDRGYITASTWKKGLEDLPASDRFRPASGALRVSPDLTETETVMLFGDVEQVMVDAPWGPFAMVPPLAKATSIAVQANEDRTCIGEQEGPEVMCFGPDGSRTAVRWPERSMAVDENEEEEEEEVVAWREAAIELYGQKLSRDDVRRLLALIPVPSTRPEYSEILLDHDGNLWVKRGPTGDGEARATEYLVFAPSGALLGAVPMPPVRILEIGPDYVVGVHQDELEVEYVQVFKIVKPPTSVGTR